MEKKPLKAYKETLKSLSLRERETCIGLLLGDACLQTQDGGKSYRLKLLQGGLNILYFYHLSSVFSRWVLSDPAPQHRSINGRIKEAWRTQTFSHSAFNFLAPLFYDKGGRKYIVPCLVEHHLTPRGFAYWLMDDGGKSNYNKGRLSSGICINTQAFTESEVDSLVVGLQLKFGLQCWRGKNGHYATIIISARSVKHLSNIVGAYIHPSMFYKFPQNFFSIPDKVDEIV